MSQAPHRRLPDPGLAAMRRGAWATMYALLALAGIGGLMRFIDGPAWLAYSSGAPALLLLAMRGFQRAGYHPGLNQAYMTWLRATPWTRDRPLPLGPVALQWPDWLTAAAGSLACWAGGVLPWPVAGLALLVPWTWRMSALQALVGAWWSRWLLWAGAVAMFGLQSPPLAWLAMGIACYLATLASLPLTMHRIQVDEPADAPRPAPPPASEQQVGFHAKLGPRYHRAPLPAFKYMAYGLIYAVLALAVFARFGDGQDDNAFVFILVYGGLFLSVIPWLVAIDGDFKSPLSLAGRIRLLRPIIWRHDRAYLLPIIAILTTLATLILAMLDVIRNGFVTCALILAIHLARVISSRMERRWFYEGAHRIAFPPQVKEAKPKQPSGFEKLLGPQRQPPSSPPFSLGHLGLLATRWVRIKPHYAWREGLAWFMGFALVYLFVIALLAWILISPGNSRNLATVCWIAGFIIFGVGFFFHGLARCKGTISSPSDEAYWQWLRLTPWRRPQPLPLGSPLPARGDLALLGLTWAYAALWLIVFMIFAPPTGGFRDWGPHFILSLLGLPLIWLVGYTAGAYATFIGTGRWRERMAISACVGVAVLCFPNWPWMIAAGLPAIGIALWGMRGLLRGLSFRLRPWKKPMETEPAQVNARGADGERLPAAGKELEGTVYALLGPEPPIPPRRNWPMFIGRAAESAWWTFLLLSLFPGIHRLMELALPPLLGIMMLGRLHQYRLGRHWVILEQGLRLTAQKRQYFTALAGPLLWLAAALALWTALRAAGVPFQAQVPLIYLAGQLSLQFVPPDPRRWRLTAPMRIQLPGRTAL